MKQISFVGVIITNYLAKQNDLGDLSHLWEISFKQINTQYAHSCLKHWSLNQCLLPWNTVSFETRIYYRLFYNSLAKWLQRPVCLYAASGHPYVTDETSHVPYWCDLLYMKHRGRCLVQNSAALMRRATH